MAPTSPSGGGMAWEATTNTATPNPDSRNLKTAFNPSFSTALEDLSQAIITFRRFVTIAHEHQIANPGVTDHHAFLQAVVNQMVQEEPRKYLNRRLEVLATVSYTGRDIFLVEASLEVEAAEGKNIEKLEMACDDAWEKIMCLSVSFEETLKESCKQRRTARKAASFLKSDASQRMHAASLGSTVALSLMKESSGSLRTAKHLTLSPARFVATVAKIPSTLVPSTQVSSSNAPVKNPPTAFTQVSASNAPVKSPAAVSFIGDRRIIAPKYTHMERVVTVWDYPESIAAHSSQILRLASQSAAPSSSTADSLVATAATPSSSSFSKYRSVHRKSTRIKKLSGLKVQLLFQNVLCNRTHDMLVKSGTTGSAADNSTSVNALTDELASLCVEAAPFSRKRSVDDMEEDGGERKKKNASRTTLTVEASSEDAMN
ncbi:hypothetical protein BC829DRAFT_416985 [Chytridium lagenaria]|nr:hypothetical protein BC829DRAFT_416985 [Chytridium lagenaria]